MVSASDRCKDLIPAENRDRLSQSPSLPFAGQAFFRVGCFFCPLDRKKKAELELWESLGPELKSTFGPSMSSSFESRLPQLFHFVPFFL